ncbi:hypothetical protein Pcinc_034547 [Petrolisthes cinctipes]|uniref:U6 small nuclear RNA (adenine-(43)-N(6))-methyltransferase n=1 Tax=Petrolisthes cinctipes TaxID=88211 RepID=A0AAE1C222_PETCI|nr:hypothetical protein Pcinc_034547 [Petrolisthes cinctipes]
MSVKEKKVPPKLNKFMHPRNPYRTPPSFKKLASVYPEFRPYCSYDVGGKVHLDFKDPKALRALTTCLLHQDFDLKVTIPDERLVPTLPLRLNYLLWIEDLLMHAAHCDASDVIVGVDIGTGASCVYPLLAARKLGWNLVATETDNINFTAATTNVNNNDLQDTIIVKKVDEKTVFQGVLDDADIQKQMYLKKKEANDDDELQSEVDTTPNPATTDNACKHTDDQSSSCHDDKKVKYIFDFTMCNPPFFSSEEETDTMKKSKKQRGEPVSSPTGSIHEKVTTGGEVTFITQMVEESHMLKNKVRIFTSLIGTKSHVKEIKSIVSSTQPTSLVMTEFCQGRTMRWGVAWTYEPGLDLCQVKSKKDMLTNKPVVLNVPRSLVSVYSIPSIWSLVNKWLQQLKVKVRVLKKNKYFISVNVKAFQATWLHQRRKKRQDKRNDEKVTCVKSEEVNFPDHHINNGKCYKRKLEREEDDECQEVTEREKKMIKLEECVEAGNDNKGDSVALGGKDGLNQVLQYMRNQLTNPHMQ